MPVLVSGCHGSQPSPGVAVRSAKVYKLRGKVVSTNPTSGEVTVNHAAIPGFMEAMTMPYKLKDPSVLSELHAGDVITADLLVSHDANADVLLDHIVVIAEGKPDYKPTVQYHVPAPGDAVPDFKLRNQDGRAIALRDFKGKALLVTFIYTRCPRPDFCPRVTRNFAAVAADLAKTPLVYGKTHLLCISFDPENDTPERLRAYGATYLGSEAADAFTHWDFAVPKQDELAKLTEWFDVGMSSGPDDSITHTLSTTLIGPDGKVVKFYEGNEWTPQQVTADVRTLLGS